MKLSQAIRIGSKAFGQAYGRFIVGDKRCPIAAGLEGIEDSTAIGAIKQLEQLTDKTGLMVYSSPIVEAREKVHALIEVAFPILLDPVPSCPVCPSVYGGFLKNMIFHLVDNHRWGFEKVAKLVEEVECRTTSSPSSSSPTPSASPSLLEPVSTPSA